MPSLVIPQKASQKVIHSLRGSEKRTTLVIRNGCRTEISTEDVVPGDILVLKSGNYVAADARLLETDLSIDESALTGESIPVKLLKSSLVKMSPSRIERT